MPHVQVQEILAPAPDAASKAGSGKKAKAAAKAAATKEAAAAKQAAATALAEAAAQDELRCDVSGADAAQEMLLAVVEGHPERLQDAMQLLVQTAQANATEVLQGSHLPARP